MVELGNGFKTTFLPDENNSLLKRGLPLFGDVYLAIEELKNSSVEEIRKLVADNSEG